MNKLFMTFVLSIFSMPLFAQINMADSTAQVISYWNIGDKQSYDIVTQKLKIEEGDTTSNEIVTYEVNITVLDSTENSYTVEWFYHNYQTNSEVEFMRKCIELSNNLKVIIELDKYGTFTGVKNWEEVRDTIQSSMNTMFEGIEMIPQVKKILDELLGRYNTKQAVEAGAISDVLQFHFYHGGKYKLGEVLEVEMEAPNLFNAKKHFDTKITMALEEINDENAFFVLERKEVIDSEQLLDATYDYMKKMMKTMGVKGLKKKALGNLTNVITARDILHETGWPLYSIHTKITENMGKKNVEERVIELK